MPAYTESKPALDGSKNGNAMRSLLGCVFLRPFWRVALIRCLLGGGLTLMACLLEESGSTPSTLLANTIDGSLIFSVLKPARRCWPCEYSRPAACVDTSMQYGVPCFLENLTPPRQRTKHGNCQKMPRYADCIFLYPHGGGLDATNYSATTEEKTTLAARSVQRYLDRTPTEAVRCCCCRSREARAPERPHRVASKCGWTAGSGEMLRVISSRRQRQGLAC